MARISLFLIALLGVYSIARAAEPTVSEYSGKGQWHDISRPAPVRIADNPTLNHVEQLVDAHQTEAAHDLLSPWLKDHRQAPDRDRALFLLAHIYFQQNDRLVAYYHLDELMDQYPESKYFPLALEFQYRIADAFLNGYKRTFLGFHILSADDEAIQMLYRIQERSPGSEIAERSLLRTADYYFRTSQFDLSGDAYASFVREYPRSSEIPFVKLREAFSSLAQFRGSRYDATALLDARAQFSEILQKYPDLAAEESVPDRIERIDETLAVKLMITGDYYSRTTQPRAAAYVYRYVIATYPQSKEADKARRALDRLPAWALRASSASSAEHDVPPVGPGRAPSSN